MKDRTEPRLTARKAFDDTRKILDTMIVDLGGEPLPGSSPVYVIAWKHWEPIFERASTRGWEANVENWVFNCEAIKACKKLIGQCLQAYTKEQAR